MLNVPSRNYYERRLIPKLRAFFAIGDVIFFMSEFLFPPESLSPRRIYLLYSPSGKLPYFLSIPVEWSNLAFAMFSIRHCKSSHRGPNRHSPFFRNFIWDLALTKLYSNCLLSTLNARASLQELTGYSASGARHAVSTDRNRRLVRRYFPYSFLFRLIFLLSQDNTIEAPAVRRLYFPIF